MCHIFTFDDTIFKAGSCWSQLSHKTIQEHYKELLPATNYTNKRYLSKPIYVDTNLHTKHI